MKLFFVLAVATSSLLLLVQGAPSPQIRSEELGKAMEQLKEMIKSEIQAAEAEAQYYPRAKSEQYYPWAKSEWGPRAKSEWGPRAKSEQHPRVRQQSYDRLGVMYEDRASAQVSGVVVRNCGTTGDTITAALSPLNIFSSAFGVLVDCQISQGCIQVRVDVPANDRIVDIDICDLGNGQACVDVYVEPTQPCVGAPITIPIPLPNGQQIFIQVTVVPPIPFVNPQGCATVTVNAPQCPATGK